MCINCTHVAIQERLSNDNDNMDTYRIDRAQIQLKLVYTSKSWQDGGHYKVTLYTGNYHNRRWYRDSKESTKSNVVT